MSNRTVDEINRQKLAKADESLEILIKLTEQMDAKANEVNTELKQDLNENNTKENEDTADATGN